MNTRAALSRIGIDMALGAGVGYWLALGLAILLLMAHCAGGV